MRFWLPGALLAVLSAGCMRDTMTAVTTGPWNRMKPKTPAPTSDVVELHYIFIEREKGNKLINETVWADADEQVIPLDLKSNLKANGFRVAKLGSRLSPDMQKLLKEANPSKAGRRFHGQSGVATKVQTTEIVPSWPIFMNVEGQMRGENLADAQGFLHVTPTIGDGDSVRVAIVPEVQFGQVRNRRVAAPDLSGWQVRNEREARTFSEMTVEINLSSGDFAIVGCWPDASSSLGSRFFIRTVQAKQVQSLLLIRAARPSREELAKTNSDYDDFFLLPLRKANAPTRSMARETVLANAPGTVNTR